MRAGAQGHSPEVVGRHLNITATSGRGPFFCNIRAFLRIVKKSALRSDVDFENKNIEKQQFCMDSG